MIQCTWSMSFSDFWFVIFSSKQCSKKTVALSKETVRAWIKGWSPWVNDGWKLLTASNYTSHCCKQPSVHVAVLILIYWCIESLFVTLSFDEELFSSYFNFDEVGCRNFHFTLIFFFLHMHGDIKMNKNIVDKCLRFYTCSIPFDWT